MGRAPVPNPGGFLTPGQSGRLQFLGSGEFDALLVPDSAILSDQSRRFVWTVGKDDLPEQRAVEPGNLERGLRIVRAGLRRDNRVVINGMQRVRPGVRVEVTRQAASIFKALGGGWSEAERLTSAQLADDDRAQLQRIVKVDRR